MEIFRRQRPWDRLTRQPVKGFLSGIMALVLAVCSVPLDSFPVQAASIRGFEVSLQWVGSSDADTLVWNSSREEKKTITMQVNYRNNQGGILAGFPAGAITIQVPGIGMAGRGRVQAAAGVVDNAGGEKTWNYTYDGATDTYTFRNVRAVDSETSFAGTFQIAWEFNSRDTVNGYRQKVRAVLSAEGQTMATNELAFAFTSQTDTHTLEAQANALEGPDGLGEQADSYYWVRYGVKETIGEKARGAGNKYYTVTLPEGAVMKLAGSGDFQSLGGNTYRFPYASYQNVYVAYPRNRFGGTRVSQNFVLRGTYLDTDQDVVLARDSVEIRPSDYGFRYDGYLYWVGKGGAHSEGADAVPREDLYHGKVLGYTLMAVARYSGNGALLNLETVRRNVYRSAGTASPSDASGTGTAASPSNAPVPEPVLSGSGTDPAWSGVSGLRPPATSSNAVRNPDIQSQTGFLSPDYLDGLPLEVLTDREAFARAAGEARTRFDAAWDAYEEQRLEEERTARELALVREAAENGEEYFPDTDLVNDLEDGGNGGIPGQRPQVTATWSNAWQEAAAPGLDAALSTPSQARKAAASPATPWKAGVQAAARTSGAMDLYLMDDFLDITCPDGTFRQLGDEEYEMVDVTIPSYRSFTNANGFPVQSGKYTAEIVLGTNRKAAAAAAFPIDGQAHTYRFPAGTCRFLIRIRNVTESLYINQFDVDVRVAFHLNPAKPVMPDGIIRNNDGLVVELAGTHHNTVFDDSYLGSDADRVRQRDLRTYGTRIQRWYWDYRYESDMVYNDVYVGTGEFTGSPEGYRTTVSFRSDFRRAENLEGFSVYTLLPEGMEVDRSLLSEKAYVSGFRNQYGESLGSDWLNQGFTIHITDNYKGTGRTLAEGRYDYRYSPVSVEGNLADAAFSLPLLVSFDALARYGTGYVIQAEQMISSAGKQSSAYATDKNGRDDGSAFHDPAWKDINNNGDTGETLVYNRGEVSVTRVMATQMELKKYVSTPQTGGHYRTNRQEDGTTRNIRAYFGHEYSYKLNLYNTGSPAEHVVVYDILEEGSTTASQWKGTFQRVDTSRAQSLGLAPVVYYSAATVPGPLESGSWTRTVPADPAWVKAVAVDFGPGFMKTARDVYVEVFLKAPEAREDLVGKRTVNHFSVSYTAADQETRLDSNEVQVSLDHPKGTVSLEKTDAESGEVLTGYRFQLLAADGTVAATLTDQAMDPEEIPTGTYILRETQAPEGYGKTEDQTVTIRMGLNRLSVADPRIPGTVTLVKRDASDQDLLLAGALYSLYQADGTLVQETLRTGEDGRLTVENLPWGEYYLQETQAPEGHYLYGDPRIPFTVSARSTTVTLEADNRSLGRAELVKYDADQPELVVEGAEYTLYNAKGRPLGTWRTGADGRILAEGLEWGDYYFLEKTPAPGYLVNDSRIEFSIFRDNARELVRVEARDEEIPASVRLTKYDAQDHSLKLAGAVYSLLKKKGESYVDLGTYRTDRSGELEITGLKFGEYVLEEIAPPEGYVLTGDSRIPFTLTRDTAGTCLVLEHENKRRKGCLEIHKQDQEQVPVAGAVFDLYRDGELYLEHLVSDEYGLITVGSLEEPVLEWGSYVLKETEAPRGYKLAETEYSFTMDAGTVRVPVKIVAENRRETGSVKLVKYKKGDPATRIAGAVYRLYDTGGVCLGEETTGSTGEAVFRDIPWGAYYLQEVSAPSPYVVSGEKLRFSVNRDNFDVLQVLEAEDEVKRTSLTITKQVRAEDIYEAFGNPTFLYRIEGRDGTGVPHTWYRQITLSAGELVSSVTLANIEASDADGYKITELNAIRYGLADIGGTHIRDVRLQEQSVVADLYRYSEAEAVFTNRLEDWQKYSHTTTAVNMVKQSRQLTGLTVEYSGPGDVSNRFQNSQYGIGQDRDFQKKYLTVTAYYDVEDRDGNISRVLKPGEYRVEPGTLEGQGTAAPYTYDIRVSFSQYGTSRSGSFQVTASVSKPLYTLTYYYPHGEASAPLAQSCRYGTITLLRPEPLAGYTFGGWYEKPTTASTRYEAGASFTNTDKAQVSLYGNWIPVNYTVSYSLGGGTLYNQKTSYNIETATFTLPTPTRKGYTFRGWTGSNGSTPQTTVQVTKGSTGNKSFTASWTPVEYTITYYPNGGTLKGQRTTYTIETASFVLVTPTQAHHTFLGWRGSNGSTPQTSVTVPRGTTGNLVYSADWKGTYATLARGATFNQRVKSLTCGSGATVYTDDTVIRGIAFTTSVPAGAQTVVVSDTYSPQTVTAYVNKSTGILYLASTASQIRMNQDSMEMFRHMKALADAGSLTKLDMSNVKRMDLMFCGCGFKNLTSFSGWNMSGVESFGSMFSNCPDLTSLAGLERWNISSATNMSDVFSYCGKLADISALSGWDVSKITGMYRLFHECRSLKNLDALSRWNTASVVNMGDMFYFCTGLTSASGINNWNISRVTSFDRMFYACSVHPNFTKRAGTWELGTFKPK